MVAPEAIVTLPPIPALVSVGSQSLAGRGLRLLVNHAYGPNMLSSPRTTPQNNDTWFRSFTQSPTSPPESM